jgi:predicted ATP-dependent endonuclease of OLD family
MSRIHSLSIKNYRGIKEFSHTFGDTNCVVLIGRGDSGKTTILKAIAALLSPNGNTPFTDYDFTNMNTKEDIVIEAVMRDVPEALLNMNKYGRYHQLIKDNEVVADIESEEGEATTALKIRLTVDSTLEPRWEVISDRELGNTLIRANDRALFSTYLIQDYMDKHFSFSRGTPLYTAFCNELKQDERDDMGKRFMEINRNAYNAIKDAAQFEELEGVTKQITENALKLGLTVKDLQTLLEFKYNTFSESNVSLHSEGLPYKMFGKGSQRLLSVAIQYKSLQGSGITLIDEIEQGLEPDRARHLANLLSKDFKGQVFITTHSQDVILEPSAEHIFLMRKGEKQLMTFGADLQGTLRAYPEAFFAKRIIVGEGATEVGIIRGIDHYLQEKGDIGLAVRGIVVLDGHGGTNFCKAATAFRQKKYEVLAFSDKDNEDEIKNAKPKAIEAGVKFVTCDEGNSIENQLFCDLPWEATCKLVAYAMEQYDTKEFFPKEGIKYTSVEEIQQVSTEEQQRLRTHFSTTSKAKDEGWFKRIDHGQFVGRIWSEYASQLDKNCRLKMEYNELMKWINQ